MDVLSLGHAVSDQLTVDIIAAAIRSLSALVY